MIAALYKKRWAVELFFEMGEAKFTHQTFLWNVRERGEDVNLDRRLRLYVLAAIIKTLAGTVLEFDSAIRAPLCSRLQAKAPSAGALTLKNHFALIIGGVRFSNAACVLGFAVMTLRLSHVRRWRSRSLRASARADCGGISFCDARRFPGGLQLDGAARLLGGLCFCDAARFCFYNGLCF